jgi:hypothetical protein
MMHMSGLPPLNSSVDCSFQAAVLCGNTTGPTLQASQSLCRYQATFHSPAACLAAPPPPPPSPPPKPAPKPVVPTPTPSPSPAPTKPTKPAKAKRAKRSASVGLGVTALIFAILSLMLGAYTAIKLNVFEGFMSGPSGTRRRGDRSMLEDILLNDG